jgi:hypothetical protein
MTATEFMERATATINDVALACAHTPDHVAEGIMGRWSVDLRAGWRKAIPWLGSDNIDTVVDDVIARVRLRRRDVERGARVGEITGP